MGTQNAVYVTSTASMKAVQQSVNVELGWIMGNPKIDRGLQVQGFWCWCWEGDPPWVPSSEHTACGARQVLPCQALTFSTMPAAARHSVPVQIASACAG